MKTVTSDRLRVTGGRSRIVALFCMLLLIFSSCTKEKETERSYPRVATGVVANINAGGATFNGSFLQTGNSEIIDHGFVYDVSVLPDIQSSEKISLGASPGSGSFTATANFGMEKGKTYYVSAYAQNKDKIFYAEAVSFVSMGNASPEIFAIVPPEGLRGDTVMIRGKYFSQQLYNNRVQFGEIEAYIISSSDTAITVRVPETKGMEHVDVFVTTAKQTAQKVSGFKYLKPVITGLSPKQGVIGDTITITGKYLRPDMEVKFNQAKAKVYKSGNISARVIVPACQSTQANISATIDGLTSTAELTFTYAKAEVTGLSADKGVVGDTIVITGKNFGYSKDVVSVFVGEQPAIVTGASNSSIKAVIPVSGGKTTLPLSIQVDGQLASGYQMFTYMTPVIESFEPTSGKAGTIVTIKGQYFSKIEKHNSIVVDQVKFRVLETKNDLIKVVIPDTIPSANAPIVVKIDGKETSSVNKFEVMSPWAKKNNYPEDIPSRAIGFSMSTVAYLVWGNYWWQYLQDKDQWVQKDYDVVVIADYRGFELNGEYHQIDASDKLMKYNPSSDQWIEKSAIDVRSTISPLVFSMNNKGYMIKHDKYDVAQYETWSYNPGNDSWSQINVIGDFPKIGFCVTVGNKAYISFGQTIWEYAPEQNTWKEKINLPSAISGARALSTQDKIYFISGIDVYEYNPSVNQIKIVSHFPGKSGNKTFSFALNNKIYVGYIIYDDKGAKYALYEFDPSKL